MHVLPRATREELEGRSTSGHLVTGLRPALAAAGWYFRCITRSDRQPATWTINLALRLLCSLGGNTAMSWDFALLTHYIYRH